MRRCLHTDSSAPRPDIPPPCARPRRATGGWCPARWPCPRRSCGCGAFWPSQSRRAECARSRARHRASRPLPRARCLSSRFCARRSTRRQSARAPQENQCRAPQYPRAGGWRPPAAGIALPGAGWQKGPSRCECRAGPFRGGGRRARCPTWGRRRRPAACCRRQGSRRSSPAAEARPFYRWHSRRYPDPDRQNDGHRPRPPPPEPSALRRRSPARCRRPSKLQCVCACVSLRFFVNFSEKRRTRRGAACLLAFAAANAFFRRALIRCGSIAKARPDPRCSG